MPRKKKEKNTEKIIPNVEKSSEEIVEYFDIEKEGKDEIVKVQSKEIVNEKVPDFQIKKENNMLKYILIAIGILMLATVGGYFVMNSMKSFNYDGITFNVVKEIAPYKTSIPVMYKGNEVPYNFYLRNDPRNLEYINFNGNINFEKTAVINATNNLNCDGMGIIAIANIVNLYRVFGTDMIKDQNASCDSEGRYMFINVKEGNESKINQFGPSCYDLVVNNCEILEVTEKFMIESISEAQKMSGGF